MQGSRHVQEGVAGMDTYADFQGAIVRSKVDRLEAEAAAERLARAASAQRAEDRRSLEAAALAHEAAKRSVAPASDPCDELKAA
jgi:hypothetical protein